MNQVWEEAAEFLRGDLDSEELERLQLAARIGELDNAVDGVLVRWSRTQLANAATERELMLYQCMVTALLQLRNAIVGKLGKKP